LLEKLFIPINIQRVYTRDKGRHFKYSLLSCLKYTDSLQ